MYEALTRINIPISVYKTVSSINSPVERVYKAVISMGIYSCCKKVYKANIGILRSVKNEYNAVTRTNRPVKKGIYLCK